jgi:6-pyruvoyltetrahydropterin/6-carboxytetrahydropterin synthase
MDKVQCQVCKEYFKVITHKHLKKHDLLIDQYKIDYPDASLFSNSYIEKLKKSLKGKINIGENNPAKRLVVKNQISNSIKDRWDEGRYTQRINGMKGMQGELSPQWKEEIHNPLYLARVKYVSFLSQYEDTTICRRCGEKKKINIHHVDEDRNNFLPSNLEPLCVPCHTHFHYSLQKQPFISIGKTFTFASAHRLPSYEGACHNWHGHEWSLEVVIRKRIDKKSGMVLDFSVLKKLVTEYIINKVDHNMVNNVIKNPTAENILIWVWDTLMFDAHLKGIEKISLWETPSSVATLTKEGMLSILSHNIEEYWKEEV